MECLLEEGSCHGSAKNCRYLSVTCRVLKRIFSTSFFPILKLHCLTWFDKLLQISKIQCSHIRGCECRLKSTMVSRCQFGFPFAFLAFLGKLVDIWTIGVFSCLHRAGTRTFPSCCFPAAAPRFVDTRVASQLEEKPRAKTCQVEKKERIGEHRKKVSACGDKYCKYCLPSPPRPKERRHY